MKRARLAIVFGVSSLVFAQTPDPALASGLQLLEEGRTTLEQKPLADARAFFTQLTQKDANNAAYFYQLARADRYLVESYARSRDKSRAESTLDDAIAAVQRSLSLNDKSADAHSLLADLYGRRISFGGFMVGARFGPRSDSENKKALALDDKNPRVYASLGRQYLHAPRMFGGDVDKAIASFRKAIELDPNLDENHVWLAIACRKKGDAACADQAIQDALRLNPRSALAKNPPYEK